MQQEPTGDGVSPSKTEKLREQVSDAGSDIARLAAQLALARHYADASDDVNGLATAREARALALRLKDYPASAHALCSASVSHYHRSDYVSADATAMDAWDFARRAESPADSLATRGVAGDTLAAAQLLLADALDMGGEEYEAALLRTSSDKLGSDNAVSRNRAAEDARRLAAKIIGGAGDEATKP